MSSVIEPETLGNYRIVSKLGQGGMGTVYRALQGTLDRPVALKILPTEFATNAEYVQRFLREARTVSTLRHENVVQVYDAGKLDGKYYIAMELVDGHNLLSYIETVGKIHENEGLDLLYQAAKGLAAAHTKGLVHRDIKPENLLLGTDKILRIVDFGLVMESTSTTQLTTTGACLGTPMYMSPEQADGELADHRTDLYSLGVAFYKVFTGQTPFHSTTVMNLLFKHKFEAPPDPRAARPDLNPNIANLLLHMIAKRRDDRPESAQKLVEMIEGIRQGKPVPPPPISAMPATQSGDLIATQIGTIIQRPVGPKPSPIPYFVGAAGVALLIGGGLYFALTSTTKRDGADDENRAASSGSEKRSETTEPTKTPEKETKTAPPISPDPVAKLQALRDEGDALADAGKYSEAKTVYGKALALAPDDADLKMRLAQAERAITFDNLMGLGRARENAGDLKKAATFYEEALAFDDGTRASEALERVQALLPAGAAEPGSEANAKLAERETFVKKAEAAFRSGRYEEATQNYSRAAMLSPEGSPYRTALADKARESQRQDYLSRARAAETSQDFKIAEDLFTKAQAIKNDPVVQQRLDSVRQRNRAPEGDKIYERTLREGQASIDAGDLRLARIKYDAAKAMRPEGFDAPAKLKEIEARDLLIQGNAASAQGDAVQAARLYNDAIRAWPGIETEARAKLAALPTPTPTPTVDVPKILAKIDPLLQASKDDEALAEIAAALKLDAQNKELLAAKTGIENLKLCDALYAELRKHVETGQGKIRDARDIDDDRRSRELKAQLDALKDRFVEKQAKVRPLAVEHRFDLVQASLNFARSDASDLAQSLTESSRVYDEKADRAAEGKGINFGIGRIGTSGDRRKADRYRAIAEGLRRISDQVKALKPHKDERE